MRPALWVSPPVPGPPHGWRRRQPACVRARERAGVSWGVRGVPGGPQPQPGEGAAPLDQPPRAWGLTQHRTWWPHPRPQGSCRVPALPTALPRPGLPLPGPHGAAPLQRLPDRAGTWVGRGWPSLKPCGVQQAMAWHAGGSPPNLDPPLMTEGVLASQTRALGAPGVSDPGPEGSAVFPWPVYSSQTGRTLGASRGFQRTAALDPAEGSVPGSGPGGWVGGPWQEGWGDASLHVGLLPHGGGPGDGCWSAGVSPA